jgi:hypothetical protein
MIKELTLIGRAEKVSFPNFNIKAVPARIDTGARTSSIWASNISVKGSTIQFVLFDKSSPLYNGEVITIKGFSSRNFATSTGQVQHRYVVKLLVQLKGRKIHTNFSLANRAEQVYPVLIGRNTLRGKFIVDVSKGTPQTEREKERNRELQEMKAEEEVT